MTDRSKQKTGGRVPKGSPGSIRYSPDGVPFAVIRISPDGAILYANTAGRPVLDAWHSRVGNLLPTAWRKHVGDVMNSGSPGYHEIVCDGWTMKLTFLLAEDGSGVDVYGQDITDQKQAERRLRSSVTCFHNVVERSPEGIIVVDKHGIVRYVNAEAISLFGIEGEDLVGEHFAFSVAAGCTRVIDLMVGRNGALAEMRVGDTEWDGEPASLVLIRDVTEQRRTAKALRDSEETGRVLLDATNDAALLIDLEGVIVAANETAVLGLGTAGQEIQGVSFYDVLPGDVAESTREQIEKVMCNGVPGRYEEKRAGIVHSIGVFPVFDDQGKIERVAVFSRDITQEKEVDRMKTEFVSIASHELRTPLSNITEAVSQVTDGLYGQINPEQLMVLGIAHRNCERLARLVHDLLDISRIESGKIVFHRTLVDMGEMVRKLCDMYQSDAEKKELQLRSDVGSGIPMFFGDADRLEQVLVNLIGNAVSFTPSGGAIAVEVAMGETSVGVGVRECGGGELGDSDGPVPHTPTLPHSHTLCISVSDTGIGIAPENLDSVFDKFVTIASAAHGGDSGTGLGLAISRQLVQLHGGEIWAESEPGQGARFVVTLPDYQSEAALMAHLVKRIAKADASHTGIDLLAIRPRACSELHVKRGGCGPNVLHKLREALAEGLDAGVNIWCLEDSGELVIVSDDANGNSEQIRQAILHGRGKYHFSMKGTPIEIGLQSATACYPGGGVDAHQLRALLRDRVSKAEPHVNVPKKVLIVDDDERALSCLALYFREQPLQVLKATSGEQALELATKDAPDLILLDMGLPGMSGYELVGALRQKIDTSRIPLIIATGQDVDESKRDVSLSSIPVLTKPFTRAALLDQVYRLLDIEIVDVEST